MRTIIFVYGSLKQGEPLHDAMAGADFIREGEIQGDLYDLGSFPAAVNPIFSSKIIRGELYLVDDRIVRRLDKIEGHPNFYVRTRTVELQSGEEVWAYFLDGKPADAKPILNGFWSAEGGMQYAGN